jgi:flagella basal body P-ring formation protein FlgA
MIPTEMQLAILLPMLAAAATTGATTVITAASAPCRAIEGARITAADLAEVLPAFAAVAPEAVIGYAPQPGAYRNIEPEELTRFAAAHGMEYHGIATVCFEPALEELDPSRIEASLRESLKGMAIPNADLDIVEYSKFRVPSGRLSFPIESLPAPSSGNTAIWNGFVEHEHRRYPVWARVRIVVPLTRVVAVGNLRAGQKVESGDVRIETVGIFPTRSLALQSLSDCVGMLARRYLTAGTPVSAADLMPPYDVDRGDIVTVEVQSGGAVLVLEAEAQASGREGQSITLRNSTSGKIFRAKITGKGRALLEFRPAGV